MAIITDPDNANRQELIFGSTLQEISIMPCGALTDASATGTDGVTVNGTKTFTSTTALFTTTNNVSPGDILLIFSGQEAGHYIVDTVDSATTLTLLQAANFSPGDTSQVYEVRSPTGGAFGDGITIQALYSFSKEEWRTDSELYDADDLIRHPFPWEGITPEQMELGGGLPHDDWTFFGRGVDIDYTDKKVRNGGWETLDNTSTRVDMYGGFLSLGSMDTDAQAYYQQTDITTAPANFNFLGTVNEPVLIHDGGGGDYTAYFKAFLRKKGKSYSSYDLLTEQGLTALINKLYSFPLTHVTDPAIAAFDAEIEGNTPFTNFSVVSNDTDGITTVSTGTFTNTGATDFAAAGVVATDVLYLSTGTDAGYYTITNVATTTITVEIDNADFTTFTGDTAITFAIHTKDMIIGSTDGSVIDVDSSTGTITSVTGGFTAAGIVAGDILVITEAADPLRGVYKVISNDSDTVLTVNTFDQNFPAGAQANVDFEVWEKGMYFQYKEDAITIASPGNITLANADPDTITRASGSWITDGVTVGSIVTISGATNSTNNASFTVEVVTSATVLTLVATDSLVAEGPSALTVTAYDAFKRSIAGVTYGFHWRLFGVDSTLVNHYEYHQKQMRETTDIDNGPAANRGDITDVLMSYVAPNATTFDMYIDDLSAVDTNSVTYTDVTETSRTENYVAAGTITFSSTLDDDVGPAKYWMFYLNDDPPGDNTGADYGTINAIIVDNNSAVDIAGNVPGPSVSFDFDYDNNSQRGTGAKGTDAPVVIIAIGLVTAQFVRFDGTISRSKTNNFSLVAAQERNYST